MADLLEEPERSTASLPDLERQLVAAIEASVRPTQLRRHLIGAAGVTVCLAVGAGFTLRAVTRERPHVIDVTGESITTNPAASADRLSGPTATTTPTPTPTTTKTSSSATSEATDGGAMLLERLDAGPLKAAPATPRCGPATSCLSSAAEPNSDRWVG